MDTLCAMSDEDFESMLQQHVRLLYHSHSAAKERGQRTQHEQDSEQHSDALRLFISDVADFYKECRSSHLLRVAKVMDALCESPSPHFMDGSVFDLCQLSGRLCNRQICIPVQHTEDEQKDDCFTRHVFRELAGSDHNPSSKRRRAVLSKTPPASSHMRIDATYEPFCASLWLIMHMHVVENSRADAGARHTKPPPGHDAAPVLPAGHVRVYHNAFRCVADVISRTRKALYPAEHLGKQDAFPVRADVEEASPDAASPRLRAAAPSATASGR